MSISSMPIPPLGGPRVIEQAHSPSAWIKAMSRPLEKAAAVLSDAQIEEYTRDGFKPWEMLAQESLKIGQMVKEMAEEDARPHLPKEDIMCYNMSESSVVDLWNCWLGHPVDDDDDVTTAADASSFDDAVLPPAQQPSMSWVKSERQDETT